MNWKYWIVLAAASLLTWAVTSRETISAPPPTIVLFGDSNTAGSNWEENGYEENSKWATQLTANRTVINLGIGGNDSGEAVNRVEFALKERPDAVTVMLGTNDAVLAVDFVPKVSLMQFEQNLTEMIDAFEQGGASVILLTALPLIEEAYYTRHDAKGYIKYGGARAFHDRYNTVTRNLAKERDLPLVDTYHVFLEASGANTDEALIRSELLDESGTHLSEKGAELLYRQVEQTLTQNGM